MKIELVPVQRRDVAGDLQPADVVVSRNRNTLPERLQYQGGRLASRDTSQPSHALGPPADHIAVLVSVACARPVNVSKVMPQHICGNVLHEIPATMSR